MQNNIWAKTILSSYRHLERLAGAIDIAIEKKALKAPTGFESMADSTLKLADDIIELSERKIKYINLKVLTEKALKNLPPIEANMLIKRYIDRQSPEKIITIFNFARRTYFRKIAEAESAFIGQCALLGYSTKKLEEDYSQELWMMELKKAYERSDDGLSTGHLR